MLNWILIAMMAMLPLRSVIAFDQSSCEMHDQASMEVDHSAHSMHAMSDAAQPESDQSNNCCCCDSDMKCSSDCGMGMSVSFLAQSVHTLPVLNQAAVRTHIDNSLVFRDLAPPIRPPASLQI